MLLALLHKMHPCAMTCHSTAGLWSLIPTTHLHTRSPFVQGVRPKSQHVAAIHLL